MTSTQTDTRSESVQQDGAIYLPVGVHIDRAAEIMVEEAGKRGATVTARFNDVRLSAEPDQDPAEIADAYRAKIEADAAAWRASPEGQAAAAKREADVNAGQAIADRLALAVQSLDFTDQEAVVRLLYGLQGPSDDVGVKVDSDTIVKAFAANGLVPNMCVGPEYRDDPDTNYRYLVGQALDGLSQLGAIHPMFRHFADEWLAARSAISRATTQEGDQ